MQIQNISSDTELDKRLQALLKEVKKNKTIKNTMWIYSGIIVVIIYIIMTVIERTQGEISETAYYVPAIIYALCFLMGNSYNKRQKESEIKITRLLNESDLVRRELENIFEMIEYDPENHIDDELLWEAQMNLQRNMHYHVGRDYFKAKYKGVEFMFSNVQILFEVKGGDRDDTTVILFEGKWLTLSLKREINPPVIVSDQSILNNRKIFNSRPRVQTESAAFNNQFVIFAEDAQTAFMVLTPHFMEFIMSAREVADGKKHICFTGSRIHIAVSSDRFAFEPCKNVKDLPSFREKIQGDAAYIKAVIDEFLLNERLFDAK
jgi:hypothetical protein